MTDTCYLDTIREAHRNLLGIKHRLYKLSGAMTTLGLKDLGYELFDMAEDIGKGVTAVNGAVSQQLNEHVRSVEQGSINMVLAAMAVASNKHATD